MSLSVRPAAYNPQGSIDEQRVVVVADTYSCRRLTAGRLLAMALATPKQAEEPVDEALAASLKKNRPDIQRIYAKRFEAATPERRYSLARVEGFLIDNQPQDLVVMRGDFESVLDRAEVNAEDRTPLRKQVEMMERLGYRCLAVASAKVGEQGEVGTFYMEGVIALAVESRRAAVASVARNPNAWVRVNLWSVTLRVQHWANMFLIIGLSITGYLIMAPDLLPVPSSSSDTGYMFGLVRFVHYLCGFGWLFLGATRLWLAFYARDKQLRWRSLWPLRSKKDWEGLKGTIRYYLFLDRHGPTYLAHNPLQQLSYTGIYAICLLQMYTGLALYGLYNQYNWFWRAMAYPMHWVQVPTIRFIHAIIMFVLWAFVVIHVYLAVRADSVERHGGVSSMINGGVWLRRGTKPMDAPKVG
ncbi:Ni/Fe-hydrogenase, b-type cytochrome subunit [Corynebacterium pelargi]|uniref:Putative Ni/Fe-hydrogenase 1 B-type cytochrome subunit n=1 Tax=Corynebacterium pelargi TaxID=1471400 RepID=A0A410WBU6_9CORY|nr:Ni/Fe-hydrogenase, b-type cytochrome subunit [Corynebacterium pelargi]QAU53422.1 putative Ni/Fe-hydrogenase 1 B-type cytochrome subunit [Corynebacterium pelargi]GGG82116.1 hypothetical protein GCM10007338_21220 [Corynebacterium pelargi]